MFYYDEDDYLEAYHKYRPKSQSCREKYHKTIHKVCVREYIRHRENMAYDRGLAEAMPRAIQMAERDELIKRTKLRTQRLRLRMAQARDKEAARSMIYTMAPSDEPIDLIRDIEWVYKNLGVLFVVTTSGTKMLNPDVLKQAPSAGAISFATYALENQMAFFDKFVSMLLRQQVSEDTKGAAVKEEKKMKAIDESLKELEAFIK